MGGTEGRGSNGPNPGYGRGSLDGCKDFVHRSVPINKNHPSTHPYIHTHIPPYTYSHKGSGWFCCDQATEAGFACPLFNPTDLHGPAG